MLASIAIALALSLPPSIDVRPRAAEVVLVPRGRSILLDGRAEEGEWEDAARVPLGAGVQLLLKHDGAHLYAAVVLPAPRAFGLNLFLAPADTGGAYVNLHASARLGERSGRSGQWPEWQWWNNDGWAANVARFNGFEGQRFLPDVAKELQIALRRLPAREFRISLDVETAGGAEHPVVTGIRADGKTWCVVRLAP